MFRQQDTDFKYRPFHWVPKLSQAFRAAHIFLVGSQQFLQPKRHPEISCVAFAGTKQGLPSIQNTRESECA